MGEVRWTPEQEKVIDLRNRNILVSAAAGSGKTAVLVQRIIKMLTDSEHPMDVDELLCVTFTEAAAAEMKERVRDAIEKELEKKPGDEHLLRQATLIHNAQITTIHSFCLSVIRDHFHAIDIDPGFRIAEEGELKLLKQDVLADLLESRYEDATERFLDFSLAYGSGKTDKALEELILKIFEYSRSYPDPEKWLSGCQKMYEIHTEEELESSPIMERTKRQVRMLLSDAIKMNERAIAICQEPDGPYMYQDALELDRVIMDKLEACNTYRELQSIAVNMKFAALSRKSDKSISTDKRALVKTIRDNGKDILKMIADKYLSDAIEDILSDLKLCSEPLKELISLVEDFGKLFEATKRSQNMIDFSDMEQYAMRILNVKDENGNFVSSQAAKEYQDHYKEIMIDEYQDSNLIQETILTSISTVSKGIYNIFMVGDVKQSIYRFRLSRPELFMEKYASYSLEDSLTQRIDLHKNFRSRDEVLQSVNRICEKIMVPELGGIHYDEDSALYFGAEYYKESSGLETELLLMDEDSAATLPYDGKEMEAYMIADRIRKLKAEQFVQDNKTGELRPARYSDIVILARSLTGYGEVLSEILTNEGIPVYVGTSTGYFSAYEVGVMLDYLQILNNRKQDLPLAAVLSSPFGLMTEEELAAVKIYGGKLPFWKAAELLNKNTLSEAESSVLLDSAKGKLDRVYKDLDRFRALVPYTPMHELLQKIYDETGYLDYVSAMPGGIQRTANLEMLLEKARTFESTSYKGLFHFIRYIEQLRKYDVDYGEANIEDEQSDTVRIMTIHKSKGLEFPIVIVANLGKNFNMMDANANVVLHSTCGIGLNAIDLNDRTKRATIVKKMIRNEEMLDTRGEELRILYVALTRAKEKLIMTGSLKKADKKIPEYASMLTNEDGTLPYSVLSTATSYMDWVLPAVLKEQSNLSADSDQKLYMDRIVDASEVMNENLQEIIKDQVTREVLLSWDEEGDAAYTENYEKQFTYQYPFPNTKNQKLKFTVTELKKRLQLQKVLMEEEDESEKLYKVEPMVPLIPQFIHKEEQLKGAARGTAYHRFLELFDYRNDPEAMDERQIEAFRDSFIQAGLMTAEMGECIQPSDIIIFFRTKSAKRMHKAALENKLFKEQPFVFGVEASTLYPEAEKGELILVQGIIDVYFEEDDHLVVLDYKTDQLQKEEEYLNRYQEQLDYYGRALEQMKGKKVTEKIIYSVTLGAEIKKN